MSGLEIVLEYLPYTVRKVIEENMYDNIEEIRLRTSKPLSLKIGQEIKILEYIVNQEDVLRAFEKVCENSVY